jgi:hypothetical protein
MQEIIGSGEMAKRITEAEGHFVQAWQIDRSIVRGFLDDVRRIGRCRVFAAADQPKVVAALRAAGYLPSKTEAATA